MFGRLRNIFTNFFLTLRWDLPHVLFNLPNCAAAFLPYLASFFMTPAFLPLFALDPPPPDADSELLDDAEKLPPLDDEELLEEEILSEELLEEEDPPVQPPPPPLDDSSTTVSVT